MIRKLALIIFLLSLPGFGQGLAAPATTLPAHLTVQEAIWPGSSHPTGNRTAYPWTQGFPIADSDGITCATGTTGACAAGLTTAVPVNLKLCTSQDCSSGRQSSQFRILGYWPSGNVKWVLVTGQSNVNAGAADTTQWLVKSICAGSCNFGASDLATDLGSTISVTTQYATIVIQKANWDWIHSASAGAVNFIFPNTHGSNDGLTIFGPASGSSCTFAVNCTTAYTSKNDSNTTAVIEENGPLRAVIKVTGSFAKTATACPTDGVTQNANCYLHFTARLFFYRNVQDLRTQVELRNADFSLTSNDNISSYKQFQSLQLIVTAGLSQPLTYFFATDTTPISGTVNGNDVAYLIQGFSAQMENADWKNSSNCTSQGASCIDSPIVRTNADVYAQNGFTVVKNGVQQSGGTQGNKLNDPQGWAAIADTTGNTITFGASYLAGNWPKSLELQNGGRELHIGLLPDQTDFLNCGTGNSSCTVYKAAWARHDPSNGPFEIYTRFSPVGSVPDAAEGFLEWQHKLLARAPFSFYNGAKDSVTGTMALTYELPDPVAEDNYYKGMTPPLKCVGTAGTCLWDVGSPSFNDTGRGTMVTFRIWNWGLGGGGNQNESHWGDCRNFLQRGGLGVTGSVPGRFVYCGNFYRYIAMHGFPRADWCGGWRAPGTPTAQCPGGTPPACPGNQTSTCTWLNRYGVLDPVSAIAPIHSLNGGQSDGACIPGDCEHAHIYGLINYYQLTGEEFVKDAILQGWKDRYLNQSVTANNPLLGSPVGNKSSIIRTIGWALGGINQLSHFLCSIGDSDCDSALTGLTSLITANNLVGWAVVPPLNESGYGEAEGCTPDANGEYLAVNCSQGQSPVRGNFFAGDNDQWYPSDGRHSGGSSFYAAENKGFMTAILLDGLMQYRMAMRDVLGVHWQQQATTNYGLFYWNDESIIDSVYGGGMWVQHEHFVPGTYPNGGMGYQTFFRHLNSTPPCETMSDCSKVNTTGGGFGTDGWSNWWGTALLSGSTVDLGATPWQGTFEQYLHKITGNGQGWDYEYGAQHIQSGVSEVINHNPSNPNDANTFDPNTVTLQDLTINVSPNPCTSASLPATCTITWSTPGNLASKGGYAYRLKYSTHPIVNWLSFHPDGLKATIGACVVDASDSTGCWEIDPASHTPWFSANSVPDLNGNAPSPGSTRTSYTFNIPAASTTYYIAMKYYGTQSGVVTYPLTVTLAGTGTGTVVSNPVGISCPGTCSANFTQGTVVTLTPNANSGSTFTGWSGDCTGTGACSVTMSAAKNVTATFTLNTTHLLTVTLAGTGQGTVTSAPLGINCPGTCSANFLSGTNVVLTAVAQTGSTFAGWSGAGCAGTGTCTVTMSSDQSVTATFNVTTTRYTLTVQPFGTGSGTVTSSPAGINCGDVCSTQFDSGTVVTLTAVPAPGSVFTYWTVSIPSSCTFGTTCTITMSQDVTVEAGFALIGGMVPSGVIVKGGIFGALVLPSGNYGVGDYGIGIYP